MYPKCIPDVSKMVVIYEAAFFIWIFCALILSFFIYRFFEKPFTDLRDRKSNGEWLRAFISDFSLIRSKK